MAATQLTADLHPLLTEYVIKKMQKNRLTTVYSFVKVEVEQLIKITNLPAESIVLVKNQLIDRFGGHYRNAQAHAAQPTVRLGTGISAIDALLQGGLIPGHIYEFCGESGSGKTLLCMTIAASVALERYSVYYIDTKCDFSGRKMQQILDRNGQRKLSEQELGHTMARIKVERIFSPELLVQVVEELATGKHLEEGTNLKLLIIDSLPSLWYLYQDSTSSAEPLGLLTKLVCSLRKLAAQHAVAIGLVNLAVRVVEEMAGNTAEVKRKLCPNGNYPALGRYWESAPGTRLLLERYENQPESIVRAVQVWKSNYLRSGDRTFVRMTGSGVR
uniref:RecA family profile 1 domain-containing protein n=1 Tax=Anopheles funestus TaxID=62324 RepID=A0A182RDL1_ANOFN